MIKKIIYCTLFLFFNLGAIATELDVQKYEFLRLTDLALQTPVYHLSNKERTINLKLIGIIHMADVEYYKLIQKITHDLDFLYYEGVKMHPTISLNDSNGCYQYVSQVNHPISDSEQIKQDMKLFSNTQGLIAQNYRLVNQEEYLFPEAHWINADLSLEQLLQVMSTKTINVEELSADLALDLKKILEPNSDNKMKRKFAKSILKSTEELCFSEKMKPLREALIEERNKVALSYIKEKMNTQSSLELGILYGSAHLPHFLETLKTEYNFTIYSIDWLDAWSLKN
jgi:hypothetical protein